MHLFRDIVRKGGAVPVLLVITVLLSGCGGQSSSSGGGGGQSGTPQITTLIFSTYLGGATPFVSGGSAYTFAQNTASDTQGNTYVTGATTVSDLLVQNAFQPTPAANSALSAFVAKYDPVGNLLWCTYLGGDNQSMGTGIAAMPGGGVAVVGVTSSDSSGTFPTMNAFQAQNNGQTDYFVTVFDASGNMLYSTYLGGTEAEGDSGFTDNNSNGNNVSVDAQGLVYITGTTYSSGSGGTVKFPVTADALQSDLKGSTDAILSIIDPGKSGPSSLVYSSFLGGSRDEKGHGITVNAAGSRIAVAGYTNSSNFPTTANAFRSSAAQSGFYSNGFITQFASSPSSHTMLYSTYLDGQTNIARDDTYGITLDPTGLIVATGRTESVDFPMLGPSSPSIYNSPPDPTVTTRNDQPYVVKIDPSLNGQASLVYATFLGGGSASGGGGAFCTAVAVDRNGSTYVGGETNSTGVEYVYTGVPTVAPEDFPYTRDAYLTSLQGPGSYDAIFMQISPDGSTLGYSTFLGGTKDDRTYGLAVDPAGNVVISGITLSKDFPVENPAQNWPQNSGRNAYVTKFWKAIR